MPGARSVLASKTVFQLRISLKDHVPVIWRRLFVPGGITLAKLHMIFQAAMGWEDYHLHSFEINGVEGGVGFLRGGARPATAAIVAFIDEHRPRFGVEPICRVLSEHGCKIAPNTYWVAKKRPPSARSVRDEELRGEILPRSGATTSRSMGPTRSGPSSTERGSAWPAAPWSA